MRVGDWAYRTRGVHGDGVFVSAPLRKGGDGPAFCVLL
jgi:hypothetical protein